MMPQPFPACCSARVITYLDSGAVESYSSVADFAVSNSDQEEGRAGDLLCKQGFEPLIRWRSSHNDGTHCTLWARVPEHRKLPRPRVPAKAKARKAVARRGK